MMFSVHSVSHASTDCALEKLGYGIDLSDADSPDWDESREVISGPLELAAAERAVQVIDECRTKQDHTALVALLRHLIRQGDADSGPVVEMLHIIAGHAVDL
jgi:hypothetical protein